METRDSKASHPGSAKIRRVTSERKRERYLRNKRLPERRPSDTGCSMSSTFLRATCSRAKMARGFLRDEKRKRIKLIFSCCIPFSNYKKKQLVELAFSDNVCAFVPVPGIAVKFPFPLPHTLLLFLFLYLPLYLSHSPLGQQLQSR